MTKYLDVNVNSMFKKRVVRKKFPREHRPYIIVYPPGSVEQKLKGRVILGANHTIEDIVQTVSDMIVDVIEPIRSEELESLIFKSLHERKLAVYRSA